MYGAKHTPTCLFRKQNIEVQLAEMTIYIEMKNANLMYEGSEKSLLGKN